MVPAAVENILVGGELPQVVGQSGDHRHGRQELLAAAGGQLFRHIQGVAIERETGKHRVDVRFQLRFHLVAVAVDHRRAVTLLVQQLQQFLDAIQDVLGHVGFPCHPAAKKIVDLGVAKDRPLMFRFGLRGCGLTAPVFGEIGEADHPFFSFLPGPDSGKLLEGDLLDLN